MPEHELYGSFDHLIDAIFPHQPLSGACAGVANWSVRASRPHEAVAAAAAAAAAAAVVAAVAAVAVAVAAQPRCRR